MPLGYQLLYRIGVTPWDTEEATAPPSLRAIAKAAPGAGRRALDLGCGTGRQAVYLAKQGWSVTGVDAVGRALAKARGRAETAGVSVSWVEGDVTRLEELPDRGTGYDLVLDMGCFHGLGDADRARCAAGINAVSAPGATFLVMAFQPGRRGPAPRGLEREELLRLLGPGWALESETSAGGDFSLPGPLRNAGPTWYRLRRTAARAN